MALQHELGIAGTRIPELDTSVLRSGEDPGSIRCESNGENEVLSRVSTLQLNKGSKTYLVPFEGLDASSTLWSSIGVGTAWCRKLPHLDSLIQTSRDKILSVGCKSN